MRKNELNHLKLLLKDLFGSIIVVIEPSSDCFSLLEKRKDLIMATISDTPNLGKLPYPSQIIPVQGNAIDIADCWVFGFEILFFNWWASSEDEYRKLVLKWIPKVAHLGIVIFNQYENKEFPYVKPVVDKAMQNHEQIMQAGNLVAYRIFDRLTADTWSIIQNRVPSSPIMQ